MGLYNGVTPIFFDLATTDREPIRTGMVVIIVVYSIQTEVEIIAYKKSTLSKYAIY